MRAYFFGNMYLSSIQQGIQAAHVMSEMFPKYEPYMGSHYDIVHCDEYMILNEWSLKHKTMILLNGGYMETIVAIRDFIRNGKHVYPWADFNEGEDALGGILTSVGIILPEKIYMLASCIRQRARINETDLLEDTVVKSGGIWIHPGNDYGWEVEEPTRVEYTKWEYDMAKKLTQFGLAS